MTDREAAKLQKLIDRAAKTANAANSANSALMDFCIRRYGFEPGDVDADYILDSIGACGMTSGIDATEFDNIMFNAK